MSIIQGLRGEDFKKVISNFVSVANDKQKNLLLSTDSLAIYSAAFTTRAASTENYEIYEFLGDSTANQCVTWYLFRRFPELDCSRGIIVLSPLKANLTSKASFGGIAEKLGFLPCVTMSAEEAEDTLKVLEDVFEASIAVTALLLDKAFGAGTGYPVVYDIIAGIYDGIKISLKYTDILDAKSRLKQLLEMYDKKGESLGVIKYRVVATDNNIVTSKVVLTSPVGKSSVLATGKGDDKSASEKAAAESALDNLANAGYVLPEPDFYKTYCVESTTTTGAPAGVVI